MLHVWFKLINDDNWNYRLIFKLKSHNENSSRLNNYLILICAWSHLARLKAFCLLSLTFFTNYFRYIFRLFLKWSRSQLLVFTSKVYSPVISEVTESNKKTQLFSKSKEYLSKTRLTFIWEKDAHTSTEPRSKLIIHS